MPPSAKPSLIVYNSRVYTNTGDRQGTPTALAVAGERIVAIGDDAEIRSMAAADTRVIDGRGNWVLPAFIDSHTHLSQYAARKLQIDLDGCRSLAEAGEKIRARVKSAAPGSWVTGGGWHLAGLGLSEYPDKHFLDEISTQHLIALQSKDWHSIWVNSTVLAACGIDENHADPAGGRILRMPNSREPSGILQEKAWEPVWQSIPPATLEQLHPVLQETFAEFHRFGITAVHSVESPYQFSHYSRLYDRGELGLRVFWYFPVRFLPQGKHEEFSTRRGSSFLEICGVKMFTDGSLGSQTAHMLAPYQAADHCGVEVMSSEELQANIGLAVAQKFSCAIHAIGDAANRKVLTGLGEVAAESRRLDLRHRIEHAQLLDPADIPLFARHRVIASMQPIHLALDVPLIEKHWGERGRYAYAFRSLQKSGARLIFGSDTPIESFDPWKGIYSAVARRYACDPAEPAFYPEEALTVPEAVAAYSSGSAYAAGEEQRLGMLKAGMLADFIRIDRDIFGEAPETLLETGVSLTVQAGRVVYEGE